MKKIVLHMGLYFSMAAFITACSESFQEAKVNKVNLGGVKSPKDASATRLADGAVQLTTDGLTFLMKTIAIEDGKNAPECASYIAADQSDKADAFKKYYTIKFNGDLSAKGIQESLDLTACTRTTAELKDDITSIEEHAREGVAQKQGTGWYTHLFARCTDADCNVGYARLVLVVENQAGKGGSELRECGLEIRKNEFLAHTAICLEKGESFSTFRELYNLIGGSAL